MADENEVVVTIEPELPGLETGTESDAAKDLASQFEEMKAQAERDRTARESADRRTREARADAAKAREEADTARGAVAESQLETVTSGLSAAESEATAAEAAIVAATEAGNFNEAAKQQRRMARAEAQAERLREAQSDIEARKTARPEPEVRRERERVPPADDPVEAYIAGRTEPTAVWLRAHTDFITDKRKNAKLTAGHHDAVADGLTIDSPEYFEHVEKFIGLRQSETGTDNRTGNGSRPSPKPQRRPSVPAAPVTSSAGGTNGGGAEVRLTRKEADAATDGTLVWNYDDPSGQKRYKKGDPLGVQEVARRKLARLKERGIENPNIES